MIDRVIADYLAEDFGALDTLPAPDPVASCGCARVYSLDEWLRLARVGLWPDQDGDLELRDCECGSTIAALAATVRP